MIVTKRRSYLDMLRIIACFLVIFRHLCGYYAYQESTNAIQTFYYLGYTMFTRINVPIFFMISGALLLAKDIGYKELFLKRIPSIVGALMCASMVVYIIFIRKNIYSFSVFVFLRKLLAGEYKDTYWYLYAYLGFLITLPLLRGIAKQMRCADFIAVIAVHFVFSTFLPLFNYILECSGISRVSITKDFAVPLMTVKAFFYPLIGYYIDQIFDITRINKRNVWILPGIILAGIVISSCFTYHQGVSGEFTQQFVETFDYTSAIAVFLLIKYLFVQIKAIRVCDKFHRVVSLLGSLTFGIYLMDPVLKGFMKYFDRVVTTQDPILYSIVWCVFSMTVGGIITFGLKKIPVVNKLL